MLFRRVFLPAALLPPPPAPLLAAEKPAEEAEDGAPLLPLQLHQAAVAALRHSNLLQVIETAVLHETDQFYYEL